MLFFVVVLFPLFGQKNRGWKKESPESFSQNPVSFGKSSGKSVLKAAFSSKSREAFPKTEVLGKQPEYKIKKMGIVTFFIVLSFSLFAVPAYFLFGNIRYFFSLYFGIFLIVYHIPGLWYCKNRLSPVNDNKSGLKLLTKRENEVAMEICSGLKYEAIANKLFISLSAVKKHTYNIYRKLGIRNNRELLLLITKGNRDI
jgi:DNA-binding CsgD family transcriptional regulator